MSALSFAPWFAPFCYPSPYKSLAGGRGSGKSHHMARLAVLRMMLAFSDPARIGTNLPYYPALPIRILSGRQFNVSLEDSVKTVMSDFIYDSGLLPQFNIGRYQITHRPTGSLCNFQGIDRNISSIRSKEGYHVWWFEEAQFLSIEQMQTVLPTVRTYMTCPVTGRLYPPEIWCVWNPMDRASWTWQRFVENPMQNDMHRHINYYQNPWLPPNMLELADYDKAHFPDMFEHIWMGQPNDGDASTQILPYKVVKSCVEMWDKRPDDSDLRKSNIRTDMGVDIALGGADKCAAVVRTGPVVHDIKLWNGTLDLELTARQSVDILKEICEVKNMKPWSIYYDGSTPMDSSFRQVKSPAAYYAVNFGHLPTGADRRWDNDLDNGDVFARRNIQMATAIRQRAMRSYKLSNGDKTIDPMNCLFLNPKIEGLDRMMSLMTQPIQRQLPNGKWDIDKRGENKSAKSPDEFDALCLAYADDSEYGLEAERN